MYKLEQSTQRHETHSFIKHTVCLIYSVNTIQSVCILSTSVKKKNESGPFVESSKTQSLCVCVCL